MKYGVVKNGKILFKYGFKEAHDNLPNNAILLPLEESPGKGSVSFVLQADKITMDYEKYEEFVVKFGSNEPVEISDKVKAFLEKHFADARKQVKHDKVFQTQWRIGNPELKRMRKIVWERWARYINEFIASKFTNDEENEEDGVSFDDLVLHSFFDGNWPIQNKNGAHALSQAKINIIKGEVRDGLIAKRTAVELACIPTDATGPVLLAALNATAKWVLTGEV